MMTPFQKIFTNFQVSWDITTLEKNFSSDVTTPNGEISSKYDKSPHWQFFKSGVRFSRHFHDNFLNESMELMRKIRDLQNFCKTLDNRTSDINEFINSSLNVNKITIIKVANGCNVAPHIDAVRELSLNIGLKNSNAGRTHMSTELSNTHNYSEFYSKKNLNFIMEDGDAYLLRVKYPHAVESIKELDRYIISYSII